MFAYNFGEALGEFAIIAWIFVIFGFILAFVLGFVCMSIMKKKGYQKYLIKAEHSNVLK